MEATGDIPSCVGVLLQSRDRQRALPHTHRLSVMRQVLLDDLAGSPAHEVVQGCRAITSQRPVNSPPDPQVGARRIRSPLPLSQAALATCPRRVRALGAAKRYQPTGARFLRPRGGGSAMTTPLPS